MFTSNVLTFFLISVANNNGLLWINLRSSWIKYRYCIYFLEPVVEIFKAYLLKKTQLIC